MEENPRDTISLLVQKEYMKRYAMSTAWLNNLKHPEVGIHFSEHEQKMLEAFHNDKVGKMILVGDNTDKKIGHKGDELKVSASGK